MKNLLIIGFVWPEPNSTAAGTRILQLIEIFKKENYRITFVSTASKTINSFDLEKINIQTVEIELNNSDFDTLIKKIDPSIVLFDRYLTEEQFGWRVSESCPNALRLLDTEDLHFLRMARQTALKKNDEVSYNHLINDISKREIASIYRCDLTLVISKYEMILLKNTFNINKSLLHYIPFLIETSTLNNIQSFPDFENRNDFMTIGNFKHEPNWNAVLYLKNVIWPSIRKKLPDVQIQIYGAYCTEKVYQLHNKEEGFIINGRAENTEEVYKNSKVCLAPLQFGAGLKGKLIDAMKYGTPSVTTNIGAEGMHKNLPWNGFISDDPDEFISKSIELYKNPNIWKKAQLNGIEIINKCYPAKELSTKFSKKIESLLLTIDKHRNKNFIGSMLMHHTLKSTKYMSKWIEEKNKN